MASRRASIVVAALLAGLALAWIAWPVDTRTPSRDREMGAQAGDATAPAPLAAAGREARPAAGDAGEPAEGAGPSAVEQATSRALEVGLQEVEAESERKTANDVLEIVVVGRTSLDGLTCTLEPLDEGGAVPGPVDPPVRDGLVFRVTRVPAGAWRVQLLGPLGAQRAWRVVVPQTDDGNHRQVVVFGSASLHGTLYGFDGRPLVGHLVRLSADETWAQLGSPESVDVTTDATGTYRIDELHSGDFGVEGVLAGPGVRDGPARQVRAVLEAGTSVRRDLGRSTPELRFTLRLTRASGTVPRLTPRCSSREVFFDDPTADARALGRFSGRSPSGSFLIQTSGEASRLLEWHAIIDVVADGQEITLTVPGVAVDGRVVEDGTSGNAAVAPARFGDCQILLIGTTADRWGGIGIAPDADGTFHFEAVPAGRYTVLVRRHRAAGDERPVQEVWVRTDVPADRDVTGLELRLPAR